MSKLLSRIYKVSCVFVCCLQVSADHRYLAYAVDRSGNESYAVYVRDIAQDTLLLVTPLVDASGQLAWALDNRTLFYTSVVRLTYIYATLHKLSL